MPARFSSAATRPSDLRLCRRVDTALRACVLAARARSSPGRRPGRPPDFLSATSLVALARPTALAAPRARGAGAGRCRGLVAHAVVSIRLNRRSDLRHVEGPRIADSWLEQDSFAAVRPRYSMSARSHWFPPGKNDFRPVRVAPRGPYRLRIGILRSRLVFERGSHRRPKLRDIVRR